MIAVCSVCVATTAAAATRTWVTDASGSWDVASNWSDGVVPQAGDVVVIDRPGVTITVTVNTGTNALASLLSNEHIIMGGGTLGATTSMEFNAGIDFSGGELTGAGALTLRGTSTWSGGTWSGAGGATLAPGATLTQTGNVYLWRPLVNQGTVTATGAMYVYGAAITNAAGAVWEAAGAWTASNQSGASTFANAGTLRKTGSGSGLVLSGVPLTNTGTLDLVAGTVTVTSATNSGVLSVAAGQVLDLANLTLASGTTFAGSGSLRLNGALAVSAAATITRPLAFDGGEVTGSGALTFAAPVTWSGGTFGGTSTATVAAGTTLVQTGNVYLSRPFINQGTVTATGAMYMYGAAITNAAGAVWEAAGAWTASNQSGASTFANAGTLRKTGSGSGLVLSGVPLTNTGTVDLVAGTVTVTSATNSGVLSVAAGQVLDLANLTLAAGTTFAGSGSLRLNGALAVSAAATITRPLAFDGGEVTGSGALTFAAPVTWSGGTFGGTGTATVAAGTSLVQTGNVYLSRPFINQGTVTATGAMYMYGAAITNAAGAVWEAAGAWTASNQSGASTFANAGTLRKTGSGSGLVLSGVPLTNTGTVDLVAGTVTVTSATNSGVLSVAAGQVLDLANLTLASGTTFAGSGSLRLNGALAVSAAVTITRPLAFDGGEVTGSGALTFAAPVTWSGGTFGGTGTATVAGGTTLVQTGNVYLSRPLVNQGTVTATGAMYVYGVPITNTAAAEWQFSGNWTVSLQSGTSTFTNMGLLRGVGPTGTCSMGLPLVNQGLIELRIAGQASGAFDRVTTTAATLGGDTLDRAHRRLRPAGRQRIRRPRLLVTHRRVRGRRRQRRRLLVL